MSKTLSRLLPEMGIFELIKLAGLEHDEGLVQYVESLVEFNDDELLGEIITLIKAEAINQQLRGAPFSELSQEAIDSRLNGHAITLGKSYRSDIPIRYSLNSLSEPTWVVGMPGTGKTNFLLLTAVQSIFAGKTFWGFEREKKDLRQLAHLLGRVKQQHQHRFGHIEDVIVFTDETKFHFNPLEVQWPLSPKQNIRIFVETFCKIFEVYELGEPLLQKAVMTEYQNRQVLEGSQNFPTMEDIQKRLASMRELHGNKITPSTNVGRARDSLVAKFDGLLFGNQDLYGWTKGYPIAELAKTNFVLELHGLSESHARFLTETLLFNLIRHAVATDRMGLGLQNLIIIDEAKWFAPSNPKQAKRHSPFAHTLALGRDAGVGLLVADQTADLDEAVLKYSSLKVCFRLGDGTDMIRVGLSLGLNDEQIQYLHKLDTGQAVIGMPPHDALLVKTPNFEEILQHVLGGVT